MPGARRIEPFRDEGLCNTGVKDKEAFLDYRSATWPKQLAPTACRGAKYGLIAREKKYKHREDNHYYCGIRSSYGLLV